MVVNHRIMLAYARLRAGSLRSLEHPLFCVCVLIVCVVLSFNVFQGNQPNNTRCLQLAVGNLFSFWGVYIYIYRYTLIFWGSSLFRVALFW